MVEGVPLLDVAKEHGTNYFVLVTEVDDDVPNQIVKNQLWVEVLFVAHMVEEGNARYLIAPSLVRVLQNIVSNTVVVGFVR